MDRYKAEELIVLPEDSVSDEQFGAAFLEVHLDEQLFVEGHFRFFFAFTAENGNIYIDVNKRIFHDPDQCIDFVLSYEWRKIFLTLTDELSFMLPLIHDLPQIVYIYIYSAAPDKVGIKIADYSKLRAIVQKDSPTADAPLLADIELFKRDLLPVKVINPVIPEALLLTKDTANAENSSVTPMQDNEDDGLPVVVWIRDNDDKNIVELSWVKNRINSMEIYVDIGECIGHIQSLMDDVQVFLISSKSNHDILIQTIINLTKIRFIYILQMEENISSPLKELSNKIRGVYFNIDNLYDHLLRDYSRTLKMSVSIFDNDKRSRTVRNLHEDNARFLWLQLLVDILIQIPHNSQTIDEMLEECKNYEKRNESMKKAAEELRQHYKSNEALHYYTNASFLFRSFNEALRTENVDFLFVFRSFLADMYNNLRQLYMEQFSNRSINTNHSLELFRGQFMTIEEFNIIKENAGRLISINSFFSTTRDQDVARIFAACGEQNKPPGLISVVFQIEIADVGHSLKRPFASLQEISKMKDEEEILFSVGTIFRIETVTNCAGTNDDWYVKLKLVNDDNDDDDGITELRKELEREFCNGCDLCSLGSALIKMGDYKRAERYFQIILEHLSGNQHTIPLVYTYLGIIYHNTGVYQKALEYHQQALKYYTERAHLHHYQDEIGVTYTHMGSNYHALGDTKSALEYFTKATQIQISPRKNSYTFNQIALIHRDNGEYKQALEYFRKALEIDENVLKLSKYNPLLATVYNNIGEIYLSLGDNESAVINLEHALGIRLKGTVSTHTDLAAIYNNLGNVYLGTKRWEKAKEVFEKALEIDTRALPENHPSLAVSHNNIASIYIGQDDLTKALYHQEMAVRITLQSDSKTNAILLATYQYNLGCIQGSLGNNKKALNILEKTLRIQIDRLPMGHENLSATYSSLSRVYEKERNIPKALEYLEKSVENARILLLQQNPEKFNHFQKQLNLFKARHLSERVELPDNADEQDELIFRLREELKEIPPDDFLQRIEILNTLGIIHSRKTDYRMAVEYFKDSIALNKQRRSLTLVQERELESIMASVYFNFARLYYRQGDRMTAFRILEKSLELASKQDQPDRMLAEVYNFAGIMFTFKRDLPSAEHYFKLAIDIAKKCLPDNHPDLQRYYLQLKQIKDLM